MEILVIRHGLSEANNKESLAFGSTEAPLMDLGKDQAKRLAETLADVYTIDCSTQEAAVSELWRTWETAFYAGFTDIHTNPLLNEATLDLSPQELHYALENKQVPWTAIRSAEAILDTPPQQGVWITHGLVIAGLCEVLGIAKDKRFIPKFCEVRNLTIN
ncbi:histidine phosphatase family protein [Candidatus Saccharibacteria bacterium]|nr:histidine phosphatase family protein [Candidatus Saccharibacteria bacterium]